MTSAKWKADTHPRTAAQQQVPGRRPRRPTFALTSTVSCGGAAAEPGRRDPRPVRKTTRQPGPNPPYSFQAEEVWDTPVGVRTPLADPSVASASCCKNRSNGQSPVCKTYWTG